MGTCRQRGTLLLLSQIGGTMSSLDSTFEESVIMMSYRSSIQPEFQLEMRQILIRAIERARANRPEEVKDMISELQLWLINETNDMRGQRQPEMAQVILEGSEERGLPSSNHYLSQWNAWTQFMLASMKFGRQHLQKGSPNKKKNKNNRGKSAPSRKVSQSKSKAARQKKRPAENIKVSAIPPFPFLQEIGEARGIEGQNVFVFCTPRNLKKARRNHRPRPM